MKNKTGPAEHDWNSQTTQTWLPVRYKETTVKQRYVLQEVDAVLAAENLPQ